uniref:Uncharacterized protein n=1 Tax=Anguilla anguilla TaxID=7936 RepID=A0A0E9RZ30_ANGAN
MLYMSEITIRALLNTQR